MNNNKEKIITKAKELFNSEGYQNVSLRDIAAACGISPGNLTYHFKKKEDLILAVMENIYTEIFDLLPQMTSHTPGELRHSLVQFDEIINRHLYYFSNIVTLGESSETAAGRQTVLRREIYQYYQRSLQALREGGFLCAQFDRPQCDQLAFQLTFIQAIWADEHSPANDEIFQDRTLLHTLEACIFPCLNKDGQRDWQI